jgi:type IV secretion system protein VirB2
MNFDRGPGACLVVGLVIGAATLALSEPALAQTTGGQVFQPLNNVMQQVLQFMTGTFATTAATIAVAALGYLMLTGNPHWRWAFAIVVGIAFIFGAATIVQVLQSNSSGSGG